MNDTTIFTNILVCIIKEQESIIGPLAIRRAEIVKGVSVDWTNKIVSIVGQQDPKSIVDELVLQYKELFGQVSVEVCKEAASSLLSQLPPEQRPLSLA
jgi:hypothetical protein